MNSKRRSKIQEKKAAEDLGGRPIPNSGAVKNGGGADVEVKGDLGSLLEAKFTAAPFYTLNLDDAMKLKAVAFKRGKNPLFQIEFTSQPRVKFGLVLRTEMSIPKTDVTVFRTDKSVRLVQSDLIDVIFRLKRRVFVAFDNKNLYFEVLPWETANEEVTRIYGNLHQNDQ